MKKLLRFLGVGVVLMAILLPCLTISPTVSASSPIDKQVNSSGDDGRMASGTDGFSNTSASYYLGYIDDVALYNLSLYARWSNITIPFGAVITSAYIQIYSEATSGTPQLKIYGVNQSNLSAPINASQFTSAILTSASADWDGIWGTGAWNTSPNISAIIQELVNANSGIYGGSIMVQIKNDGGTTQRYHTPYFYDIDPDAAPKLHIEYTVTDPPSVPFTPNGSDYGLWDWLASRANESGEALPTSWFINSSFDWLIRPSYDTLPFPDYLAQNIYNGGNQSIIIRTWFWDEPNISASDATWSTLRTNTSLYNYALNSIKKQIVGNNVSCIKAITINEEEPDAGYGWNTSLVSVPDYINVSNRLYTDVKAVYPNLSIYAFVHIAEFTGAELDSLSKDGLIDDVYTDNQTTLSAWFTRMIQRGGNNTYCILHAGSNTIYGSYDAITPAVVNQSAQLAISLDVPHIGWWAYNESAWPLPDYSVIFNDWACANLSSPNCSEGYKQTIFNIVGQTQDYPVPTPTPTPTASPTPTTPASVGGTMGTIVVIVFGLIVTLMLMGYSYSEYQRQGFNEGIKVAILGTITIVIAESILIAFF